MYLPIEELNTHLYAYQVNEISEDNNSIVEMAIKVATQKVRFYLSSNKSVLYDTKAIFEKTDDGRDPLILSLVKDIAAFEFITLCNADLIYERIKNKYDEAIKMLNQISSATTPIEGLPLLPADNITPANNMYIKSNKKFNHQ